MERRLTGGPSAASVAQPLTSKQMHALAGLWYRHNVHELEAHPAAAALWDRWEATMPTAPYREDASAEDIAEDRADVRAKYCRQEAAFLAPFIGYADELLASAGVTTDDATRDGLARLLVKRRSQALALHHKRMGGNYSPDPVRPTLPEWNPPAAAAVPSATAVAVSLRSLFEFLIREGFIAYAQTIALDATVFPDKGLDRFGNRGSRAWNVIGKWVRQRVGITDPTKAPDHSWRHRVGDELRAAAVPEDVRDTIIGHTRKTVGRQYGVRGEALSRLERALSRVPVPPGVFADEGQVAA